MKLSNVRLLTEKFDETFLFYRDVLGFKVTWGNVGDVYAHFQDAGGYDIALFSRPIMAGAVGTEKLPAAVKSQDRFALILAVDNVDKAFDDLRKKGQNFVTEPADQKDWGIRVAHLRDPDGNLIELMSELSKEKWSNGLREEADRYGH